MGPQAGWGLGWGEQPSPEGTGRRDRNEPWRVPALGSGSSAPGPALQLQESPAGAPGSPGSPRLPLPIPFSGMSTGCFSREFLLISNKSH